MDDVRRFAEDAPALLPPSRDEERVDDHRYVVTFSPGTHYWCVMVGRLRLADTGVEAGVAAIRRLIRQRGRDAAVWIVGDAATPGGLGEDLQALGLTREGASDVLALTRPPRRRNGTDLEVRAVASSRDLHRWIDVSAQGFGWPDDVRDDELARAEETLRAERSDPSGARLAAFDGDRAIGVMRVRYAPWGAYLGGAATLASDRRRGAMSALVAAAWDEADRRATPALVAYGGAMSSPTFEGLGFERTGGVVHLVDRL